MKLLSFFFIIIILFPGPFFNVDEKQNAAIIFLRFCILSTVVMIMFLSMQIILNGLHEYKCDAHITSSEMRIWSASPLYQGAPDSSHTVYVCPSEMYFSSMKGKVICAHRNSYIVVDHDDWQEVLEKVAHIIEEHMEWDLDTRDAIAGGCSLQEVVDRALPFFRAPIGVGNNGFIILAFAGKEFADESFEMMDYLSVGNGLPTDFVIKLLQKNAQKLHSDQIYYLSGGGKRIEGYARNIFYNEMIWGSSLIFIPQASFSEEKRQLFSVFSDQVDFWRKNNPESDHFLQYQRVLEDVLDDTDLFSEEERSRFFSRIGWTETAPLYYCVTQSVQRDSFLYYRMRYFLINNYPACLFFYRGASLNFILNTQQMELERFRYILSLELGDSLNIGVSAPFHGLKKLSIYHDQARLALEIGSKGKKGIHEIKDYYIRYFSHVLREGLTVELTHPLLTALRQFDAANNARLYDTLRQYLIHERRHDLTAAALGIHVNTLKYRLGKIHDLGEIDLNDPNTRMHLLISFAIQGDILTIDEIEPPKRISATGGKDK